MWGTVTLVFGGGNLCAECFPCYGTRVYREVSLLWYPGGIYLGVSPATRVVYTWVYLLLPGVCTMLGVYHAGCVPLLLCWVYHAGYTPLYYARYYASLGTSRYTPAAPRSCIYRPWAPDAQ